MLNKNVTETTLREIYDRINYHRLLHLIETSSLISPDFYLKGLTMFGFNENEISEIEHLEKSEKFGKMMKIFSTKNVNMYNTIDDVKKYCNDNLPIMYKHMMLDSMEKYENDKKYHELLL